MKAILATMTTAGALALAVLPGAPSMAAPDYPTWEEVENARADEAGKQQQIDELLAFIDGLAAEVAAAEALTQQRAQEYETAQTAYDQASYEAAQLQAQADEANTRSSGSRAQAGRIAASLSRSPGGDPTTQLMFQPGGSGELLARLGALSKLGEQMDRLYKRATTDANAAQSLTDQADVAKSVLADLAAEAERTLREAAAAGAELQARLDEQTEYQATLQAQLAVLRENRAATEADFQKGEEARAAAAAAARAAEAAAREAAARAAAPQGGGSGQPSGQGWVRPVSGWISDVYGPRPQQPVAGVNPFHYATDIAASCGTPVFAATSGTIRYAGVLGTYGNWVLIDHGGGVQTGYAHNGSLLVSVGQQVAAGQQVARVGSTGASSGCHSHFEVRVGGARIDPQPFMSGRGVSLG